MRRQAIQPQGREYHIPAPVGGQNTVASGTAMPPGDCVKLINMVSGEHGVRARLGYKEHSNGITGRADNIVRTLLPFHGTATNGADDRMFAWTSAGLFDCSNRGAATHLATWSGDILNAGYGVGLNFTTIAGNFLLYCDEAVGYLVYSATTGLWSQVAQGAGATEIAGVNPANLAFVFTWKSRVWFVERNSNNLWYLDAGSIFGTATKLPLAQVGQARHGGEIIGGWSWTVDGGAGIDDFLVVATRGGDVLVYQGTDPDSAETFALKGTWNVGAFVSGRRVATNQGGDLALMTRSGIKMLSQLVSGGDGQGTYATSKIANLFNSLALQKGELPGWSIIPHPDENCLIVTVPTYVGGTSDQLAMSLWNRSWSRFSGLPIASSCVWRGKFYFGDNAGKVHISDGYVDGVTIAAPATFSAVQWYCLTAFSDLGTPRQKQVQLMKAKTLTESTMDAVDCQARFDYDLSGTANLTETSATGNVWDVGVWDTATWSDEYFRGQSFHNAAGVGSHIAVAVKGTSRSRTVLVGVDVLFTVGGFL